MLVYICYAVASGFYELRSRVDVAGDSARVCVVCESDKQRASRGGFYAYGVLVRAPRDPDLLNNHFLSDEAMDLENTTRTEQNNRNDRVPSNEGSPKDIGLGRV